MKKIPTLFYRDPNQLNWVSQDINPEAEWVLSQRSQCVATLKKDGANVQVVVGPIAVTLHKRRNPSRREKQEGMHPRYVPCNRNDPADKHLFAALDATDFSDWQEGKHSCEALGPKIQGGVESDTPELYPFEDDPDFVTDPIYEGMTPEEAWFALEEFFETREIEGIVWHHNDGRMAKIKRRDFNHPWPAK